MTRANIVRNIINDDGYYYTKHSVLEIVNVIFDEHEAQLREAIKPKTCSLCIFWDTARPRSHHNYAECNNRKCPLSYMEVHYEFGCKMFVPKDNA